MSLYRNIQAKRKRIKAGSGEKMRKKGSKGAPTAKNFCKSKNDSKEEKIMFWVYVAEYIARRQKYEYRCFEGRNCRRRRC